MEIRADRFLSPQERWEQFDALSGPQAPAERRAWRRSQNIGNLERKLATDSVTPTLTQRKRARLVRELERLNTYRNRHPLGFHHH